VAVALVQLLAAQFRVETAPVPAAQVALEPPVDPLLALATILLPPVKVCRVRVLVPVVTELAVALAALVPATILSPPAKVCRVRVLAPALSALVKLDKVDRVLGRLAPVDLVRAQVARGPTLA
jgi:hypothetical protein